MPVNSFDLNILCLTLLGIAPLSFGQSPAPIGDLTRYLSARDTSFRLQIAPLELPSQDKQSYETLRIDPRVRYQQIEGFGGAFTEAATSTIVKMPAAKQEEILQAYFNPASGLAYTLCRTHLTSCDFSAGDYTYCDQPGDLDLKTFSIARDRSSLIPIIKRAQEISQNGFKLFASPWSPPAWMKTNGEMEHGGSLKPECRAAWALYFARYIQAYAQENIPVWGVTVHNEPEAVQTWESCIYTGPEERDFVRDYLGPTLAKEGLAKIKVLIWDHNRDHLYERAKAVLDDPKASAYVWGTAFHWYGQDNFDNVQRVHDAYPDKPLLLTEACQENGPHDGDWKVGERYGRSMIQDLNHWSVGWVDWNIVLDQTGGPNHVGNLCSAPILANVTTGQISYQPSYYFIGQFSKFIRPGAVRILSAPTNENLESVAFLNPNHQIAVVVMNRTEKTLPFILRMNDQASRADAPAHSIQTLLFNEN